MLFCCPTHFSPALWVIIESMKNRNSTELKILAAILFVAGFYGFVSSLLAIFSAENFVGIIFHLGLILIFGLTTLSGLLIFKENEKGLVYARAIVALQFINFKIAGLGYYFVTGAYLFVGINGSEIGFEYGLNTGMNFILGDSDVLMFRLNLLAIGAFIYLTRLLNQLDEEEIEEVTTHNNG